jgi:hypothetical protein
MLYGTTSNFPTKGYTVSPSVTLAATPTCNYYASGDSGFTTPITLSSTTPVGNYVVHCSGAAYTTNGATLGYAADAAFSVTTSVPDAPTGVAGTSGDSQVTVSWSAPTYGGTSSITGYTVTSTPSVAAPSGCVNTLSTSCVFTGLTNGTAYTFTVIAINSVGNSVPSSASASVTPYAAPGAPTALVLTSANNSVSLSWTAPTSNGGNAITDYMIEYQSKGDSTWTAFSHTASTATTISVTSLTAGKIYNFRVSAVNSAGAGTASSIKSTMTIAGMIQYLDASNSNSYTSGTTWYDLTGKGNNATIVGSPTFASNKFTLSGSGQYFSVSVFYSESEIVAGGVGLYTKWNQGQGGDWTLQLTDGKLVAARNYVPYSYTQNPASEINRKFIATYSYTKSTNTIRLYLNGTLLGSATVPTSTYDAMPLIGARYANNVITNFLKGDIYGATLFNTALTDAQVQSLVAGMQQSAKVIFNANGGSKFY